jgi:hypothetical protein
VVELDFSLAGTIEALAQKIEIMRRLGFDNVEVGLSEIQADIMLEWISSLGEQEIKCKADMLRVWLDLEDDLNILPTGIMLTEKDKEHIVEVMDMLEIMESPQHDVKTKSPIKCQVLAFDLNVARGKSQSTAQFRV